MEPVTTAGGNVKKADIEKLGKYQILGELGRGAMGVVYQGFDPGIERNVAIKTVRKDMMIADDPDATRTQIERFRREAQAAGRMNHPNIVGVYEYGEDGDTAFIAMEFIAGRSLKDYFDASERFDIKEIVRIMGDLLSALEYSHRNGIVHRDIKPANIMITDAGEVKITDFGIARIESSSLTQAGAVLGTPSYMSPEQFMGQRVDARSDLFSAGGVLYQFLTGEKPFTGSLTTIMHKVLNSTPEPPSLLNVSIPREFDQVVNKAMAKRPDERYQSAAEFNRALKGASEPRQAARAVSDDEATSFDSTMLDESRLGQERRSTAEETVRLGTDSRPKGASPVVSAVRQEEPTAKKGGGPIKAIAAVVVLLLVLAGGAIGWFLSNGKLADPRQPTDTAASSNSLPPRQLDAQIEARRQTEEAQHQAEEAQRQAEVRRQEGEKQRQLEAAQQQSRLASAQAAVGRIAGALAQVECSLLDVSTGDRGDLVVSGVAGTAATEAAIQQTVASILPESAIKTSVEPLAPSLCDPLTAAARYRQANIEQVSPLVLRPVDGTPTYHNGQNLIVEVTAPDYPSYLQVDYFTLEGYVVHLFPNGLEKDNHLGAAARRTLGDPRTGGRFWTIGPPFGRELIVAFATSKPLFASARPEAEQVPTYLNDLKKALTAPGQQSPLPVSAALVIKTTAQ